MQNSGLWKVYLNLQVASFKNKEVTVWQTLNPKPYEKIGFSKTLNLKTLNPKSKTPNSP